MIYLDHAATTALAPAAREAMLPFLEDNYANPSAIYAPADEARKAIRQAGRSIAALLSCSASELYFTASGSESDNMAIFGVAEAFADKGKHIITSAIEHPAVLNSCKRLERLGFRVSYLPVDKSGKVSAENLRKALSKDSILVSIMLANNEIGTIEPIAELCEIAHSAGCLFHTDAVQAVGRMELDVKKMGVDLLSCSAHKLNGPKGVGLLYKREGLNIPPLIYGGGQERGLRSGTENVAGIVGFGKAAELAGDALAAGVNDRILKLRNDFLDRLLRENDNCRLNGELTDRLPGNISISFVGAESETILIMLNAEGVCASGGSACSTGSGKPSHVLTAIGCPPEVAKGTVRFTIGAENTAEELERAADIIKKAVARARAFSC